MKKLLSILLAASLILSPSITWAAPFSGQSTFNNTVSTSTAPTTSVNGVAFPASPSIGTTPIVTGANTVTYKPEFLLLGTAAIDLSSTTAVKMGTTPNNGKLFCVLGFNITSEAATGSPTVNGATFGMGVNSPNYSDTIFAFLSVNLLTPGVFAPVIESGTPAYYQPNTDVYFKMSTPITGGTVTGHASAFGTNCN